MAHNCLEHFTTCIECGCVLWSGRSSQSAAKHHQMHERHRDRHNAASRRLDDLAVRVRGLEPEPCHDFTAVTGFPHNSLATVRCRKCGAAVSVQTDIDGKVTRHDI